MLCWNSNVAKAHRTPIDWYNFCREVSEDIVINNSEKIGGVGITFLIQLEVLIFWPLKIVVYLT
ncbi:hypothetical protein OUZ56_003568 [Daphnia magna]|uniref:Uncharacterized protein n=1 Tax=Daphnia magna TaxID=35525 RepID=A0ABR0A9G5_9CRUS|nr:hypothetical protein OUZ56_003568 [Daphnia magna]